MNKVAETFFYEERFFFLSIDSNHVKLEALEKK